MKKIFIFFTLFFIVGLSIPQTMVLPVENATRDDWNQQSFWFYPWGRSIVHKGVDIFAKRGTPVLSATYGLVMSVDSNKYGGNIIYILGPKWRLHYYAHLDRIQTHKFRFVKAGTVIGTVGNTGNASKSAPHLHYSIQTLIPYPWRVDEGRMGHEKMWYLNPLDYLNKVASPPDSVYIVKNKTSKSRVLCDTLIECY